jgi:hypothetical protein
MSELSTKRESLKKCVFLAKYCGGPLCDPAVLVDSCKSGKAVSDPGPTGEIFLKTACAT